jgi:hypothetical protein
MKSKVNGRPAIRLGPESGLASSPSLPVDIRGDAALTFVLVMNLEPTIAPTGVDVVFGLGNPGNAGDPGKPLAALVQISRTPQPTLQLAGGWGHDATLGKNSFQPLYHQPVLLTVVKAPGPMKSSTRFYINGQVAEPTVEGRDTVPDIRHRDDIGLYLGKAMNWGNGIRGDVAEIILYNKALTSDERMGIEHHLAERYAFLLPDMIEKVATQFTPQEKAFWAFQPPRSASPPQVQDQQWVKSPIDAFVLAKLEEKKLKPAQPADKLTLLRRVTFDLTGLPPAPQEIEAFLADLSADAYAKVIDRLLASPHYGERWARHWLDVVRYAESTANDANAVMRYAWRYRDYVVDAFNRDMPYDQFVIEQLAGDLLPESTDIAEKTRRAIATGFLMVGPKALAETDKEQTKLDIADEQIDVTGRTFLGLTLGCARCHDHKFDPIPSVDYYALAGIFRGTDMFLDLNPNASMWQEYPIEQGPGKKPIVVMAAKDGMGTNLRLHIRGDRFHLGPTVPRGFLQILARQNSPPLSTQQSGRLELARWIASKDNPLTARVMVNRIWQHHFGTGLVATSDNFGFRGSRPTHPELLDWLALHFINTGWSVKSMHRLILMSSAYQMACISDKNAAKIDPENQLLWRMPRRRLEAEAIRDAMLSVSGRIFLKVGGGESSEYLWEKAEVIGGQIRPNRMKTDDSFYTNSTRRSIYLPVVRNMLPDVLTLFDAADPNGVTAVRNDTTVPAQTLFLLNNPFVREQALYFAESILADMKMKDGDRIAAVYFRALGRKPAAEEIHTGQEFLAGYSADARKLGRPEDAAKKAAWQSFCQMILCSNEFLYVE